MVRTQVRSKLFEHIETLQDKRPWGRFLDAGTGAHSLQWVTSLPTEEWTAVTASDHMADRVRSAVADRVREQDRVLVGNWINDSLLYGETYDTVLMDYLIGAVDGFAPYWQERLFERFRPLVQRRLYIVGLEPYVPYRANTPAGAVMGDIGRLRDACLLLAGERPYREFPMDWVIRQLGAAGFRLLDARQFPITFGERFINNQLDMCLERFQRFGSESLAKALADHVEQVRSAALDLLAREGRLRHGADYVVAAEPMQKHH